MRSCIALFVLVLAICANAASPPGTIVIAGSGGLIYDNQGNSWAINSAGQITVNEAVDSSSRNVVELVWINNLVWQENTDSMWWSKSSPSDGWNPPEGTPVNPIPAATHAPTPAPTVSPSGTVVTAGSGQSIRDQNGNVWTINSNGQVAIDGTADQSTANVIEIAYVSGVIWQENAGLMWWSKTSASASEWLPTYGTSVNPVPPTPRPTPRPTTKPTLPPTPKPTTKPTPSPTLRPTSPPTLKPTLPPTPKPTPKPTNSPVSPSGTVVTAGSGQSIHDKNGDVWTINSNGQVAINGIADQTTAKVIEIAYVNGSIWQENSGLMWWSKTSASAPEWLPPYGTNVSPVSNPTPPPTLRPTPPPTPKPTTKPTAPPTPKPTAKPTAPPTPQPTTSPTSPSGTVVLAGSGKSIRDQNGNVWTITANGQVAVNGAPDQSTANVIEIAYVNGKIWQENEQQMWWAKTSPSDPEWLPEMGTSTSPLPAQPTPSPSPTQKPPPSTPAPTTPPGATRNYWDHPGGDTSVWNTPFGDGAVWGSPNDPDTIDLRHGGFINTIDNYGEVVWVSQSASNPIASFSAREANYEVSGPDHGSGTMQLVTAHLVPGSRSAGPYPARTDQPYTFVDTVGNPGMMYQYGPIVIENFQAGQGPFTSDFGEAENCLAANFGEDQETGHAGGLIGIGTIRGYDIDPARNPSRMAPGIPAIQHMLRFTMTPAHFKANARTPAQGNPDYPNGLLAPNSWPNNYQDYQGGATPSNLYTGNLIYGTTVGIPKDVPMPQGLTTAGQQIFWTLQHYGAIPRDAGGDFVLFADQDVPQSWTDDGSSDLRNYIVPLLLPLRNQHQGGQDFSLHPRNGPGNRVDVGPPRLNIPIVHETPSGTVVSGVGAAITDTLGNVYTITSSNQVQFNGFLDSTTRNAAQLAYVNGTVWYQSSGTWYAKVFPYSVWAQGSSPV